MEFRAFPKVPRLMRDVIVTEKIDGTNAQVFISDDGSTVMAGSRTRWIKPGDDNYGFAAWVEANRDELLKLGPGRHFGEWWGAGIQRRYGLTEKRFSLFNVSRWGGSPNLPSCCSVVPVLYDGMLNLDSIEACLTHLRAFGSVAAPGFMQPEGVMVYHVAAGVAFKRTIEDDGVPKSLRA